MKPQVVLLTINYYLKSFILLLARSRNYLAIKELKSIYYAVFSSHLNYACQIWGLCDKQFTDKIFKIQKNCFANNIKIWY